MFTILAILLVVSNFVSAIDWRIDDNDITWSRGCDFTGNDMNHVLSSSERCGQICKTTNGCTHFAWTINGVCWLKKNSISRHQAKNAEHIVCGVVA